MKCQLFHEAETHAYRRINDGAGMACVYGPDDKMIFCYVL